MNWLFLQNNFIAAKYIENEFYELNDYEIFIMAKHENEKCFFISAILNKEINFMTLKFCIALWGIYNVTVDCFSKANC